MMTPIALNINTKPILLVPPQYWEENVHTPMDGSPTMIAISKEDKDMHDKSI